MPNYNYVIDSTFQPFSLQEMLVPFTAYKTEYDKQEAIQDELAEKLGDFEYLKDYAEDSKARKLYEGYANEFNKQVDDFSRNGLYAGNSRALRALKRRYSGEIGRLKKADEALKEEQKLRRSMNIQDSSRLYAEDNLSLDSFLDNNTPNLYSVSGNDLYAKGAAASKAASSRVFNSEEGSSILKGYYIDYVQKNGYSPETINAFLDDMASVPELQRAVDDILEGTGVNENLKGNNLERARKDVIRGIVDGAVYQESHSPQRDLSKMTPHEAASIRIQQDRMNMERDHYNDSLRMNGYTRDENGNLSYDPTSDIASEREIANGLASGALIKDANGNVTVNPSARSRGGNSSSGTQTKPEYEDLKPDVKIDKKGNYSDSTKGNRGEKISYGDLTDEERQRVDNYHPGYMKWYDYYRDSAGNIFIINSQGKVEKNQEDSSSETTSGTTPEETKVKAVGGRG